MSQYTSYYLYQKYEKRGDQDWIPCYPNVYSKDGDGTMPQVVKLSADTACGYVPSGETQYRWVNMDISTDYICDYCDGLKVSGTYGSSGNSFSVNCDSSTTLSSRDIPNGVTFAAIGECVTEIGNNAFSGDSYMSGVSMVNTVTSIGNSAFALCSSLMDCSIPNSVKTIGTGAFTNDFAMFYCDLPNTIESIGEYAFMNCDSLININIPTSMSGISEGCFQSCDALTILDIPSNIISIGYHAFYECRGLSRITVHATTPPTLANGAFDNTNDAPIYVPSSSVDTYKAATGWSNYSSRIEAISNT